MKLSNIDSPIIELILVGLGFYFLFKIGNKWKPFRMFFTNKYDHFRYRGWKIQSLKEGENKKRVNYADVLGYALAAFYTTAIIAFIISLFK